MDSTVFEPVWVAQAELSGGLLPLQGVMGPPDPTHRKVRLWGRLHGELLGYVERPIDTPAAELGEAIWSQFGQRAREHLAADGAEAPDTYDGAWSPTSTCRQWSDGEQVPITVVLSTRDRPTQLRRTLDSLRQLDYRVFEVIVVDNGSDGDDTRRAVMDVAEQDRRFHYETEPVPGLSRARNRGMQRASHDIVAFTDDDCEVDPMWLAGIDRGFRKDATVACVTGIVPSGRLDTYPQSYFDRRVWWSASTTPRLYRPERAPGDSPLHPFKMGVYGTGANFAVRRELAQRLGGFSVLLGAGSPCRGGAEDGDMFVRILRSGHALAYEPSAVVWHEGRRTDADLQAQLRSYGRGIPVTGLKWLADPATRMDVLRRVPRASAYYARLLWRRGYSGDPMGAPMASAELLGTLTGTADFVRGWRRTKREETSR